MTLIFSDVHSCWIWRPSVLAPPSPSRLWLHFCRPPGRLWALATHTNFQILATWTKNALLVYTKRRRRWILITHNAAGDRCKATLIGLIFWVCYHLRDIYYTVGIHCILWRSNYTHTQNALELQGQGFSGIHCRTSGVRNIFRLSPGVGGLLGPSLSLPLACKSRNLPGSIYSWVWKCRGEEEEMLPRRGAVWLVHSSLPDLRSEKCQIRF